MAVLLLTCLCRPCPAEDKTLITIAVIAPLSGPQAEQGEWIKSGIDLALQAQPAESRFQVKVVYEDCAGETASAVSAYQSLRARYQMPVLFSWGSGIGLALSPLTNRDRVLQYGLATATPRYRSEGDFTFRDFPSAEREADFLGNLILKDLRADSIALFAVNNEYGVGLSAALKSRLNGHISIRGEATFEPKTSDFRAELLRLKSDLPSLIYLAGYPAEAAAIVKQAREAGINSKFLLSSAALDSSTFLEVAGQAADGSIVVLPGPEKAEAENFTERFRAQHGRNSEPQYAIVRRAFDAFWLVRRALEHCGKTDPTCLRDTLMSVRSYHGASGLISFDTAGDVISHQFQVYSVEGRRLARRTGINPDTAN